MSLLAYGVSDMIAVDSSFIAAVGYNSWSGTLVVLMHSGQSYTYHRVPYSVYISLVNASSVGAYYNQHIRGHYQ